MDEKKIHSIIDEAIAVSVVNSRHLAVSYARREYCGS